MRKSKYENSISMNKSKNSILAILSFLVMLILPGINSFSQDLNQSGEKTSAMYEKIYLHFDKPFYVLDETIWFKAYLVNARGNAPSTLSEIIYVELLDSNGKMIVRQILKAENGFTNGEFILPGDLVRGKYQVRAYTNWMRNFDQDFFFTKDISIYDPFNEYKEVKADSSDRSVDLQFFPEGGSLVLGLTSKVAFKAINETGKGVDVKGEIIDQEGQTITSFESFHLGMGAFELKPEKGKAYFANLISENGRRVRYAIPAATEDGIVMRVDNAPDDVVRISALAKGSLLNDLAGGLVIVAQSGGKPCHTAKAAINEDSSFTMAIPKRDLPTGIAQITLLNSQGKPLCERLIFVNHHDALRVRIETDKKSYGPREKVHVSVSVNDVHGNPVEANFSLAVTDLSQVVDPGKGEDNILSNLLLTSELRGNIEEPGFYFKEENKDAELALDYLMLSQGWRRYIWADNQNNQPSSINYAPEKETFNRRARVIRDSGMVPGQMARAMFILPSGNGAYSKFPDMDGYLNLNADVTLGKAYLFYAVDDAKGNQSACTIKVQDSWPEYSSNTMQKTEYVGPEISDCLERRALRFKIESTYGVSARSNQTDPIDTLIANQKSGVCFHTAEADYVYRMDQYNSFTSMAELFREVVHYVSYVYNKKGDKIRVYSSEQRKRFDHPPLFFVDGIPTHSKDFVRDLKPEDIESIGVINTSRKIRQFGFLGMNGVVLIQTKKRTTTPADIADQHMLEFQGCHISREFYSPVYDSPIPERGKPDIRSLLYWNPMVLTDSKGEASLSFYNTDNITSIGLRLEGISYMGTPGFADHLYTIIPETILP